METWLAGWTRVELLGEYVKRWRGKWNSEVHIISATWMVLTLLPQALVEAVIVYSWMVSWAWRELGKGSLHYNPT